MLVIKVENVINVKGLHVTYSQAVVLLTLVLNMCADSFSCTLGRSGLVVPLFRVRFMQSLWLLYFKDPCMLV